MYSDESTSVCVDEPRSTRPCSTTRNRLRLMPSASSSCAFSSFTSNADGTCAALQPPLSPQQNHSFIPKNTQHRAHTNLHRDRPVAENAHRRLQPLQIQTITLARNRLTPGAHSDTDTVANSLHTTRTGWSCGGGVAAGKASRSGYVSNRRRNSASSIVPCVWFLRSPLR